PPVGMSRSGFVRKRTSHVIFIVPQDPINHKKWISKLLFAENTNNQGVKREERFRRQPSPTDPRVHERDRLVQFPPPSLKMAAPTGNKVQNVPNWRQEWRAR